MTRLILALIFTLSAALANASENIQIEELLQGDLLFPPPVNSQVSTGQELFALNDAMRSYLNQVATGNSPAQRFVALISDLQERNFSLEYDLNQTATAAEAFSERRGNCVSFAAMIVTFAREVGLKAYMNKAPDSFGRQLPINAQVGRYMQNVMHINAVIEVPAGRLIRRFTIEEDLGIRRGKGISKISDSEARAMFLNNLAMEAMFNNDLAGAFQYSRQAIHHDSDASYLWSGLGTIYRRAGALPLAERSFQHALTLDKEDSIARKNLFLLTEAQKENPNYVKKEENTVATDA